MTAGAELDLPRRHRLGRGLLEQGVGRRLGVAGLTTGLLWIAIWWALS